jgi:hypothetical protein
MRTLYVEIKQNRHLVLLSEKRKRKENQSVHRSYSFCVDGVRYHVCKNYFLATLGVSELFVHNALRNQQGGVYLGTDKRGKHEPHNNTTTMLWK